MAGRPPKEKSFANMLNIAVREAGKTGAPKLRELADKLVDCALAGEGWAMQQVADRLDGKPAQAIIGGDENDPAINVVGKIINEIVSARPQNTNG
jgi:hypothetical protein